MGKESTQEPTDVAGTKTKWGGRIPIRWKREDEIDSSATYIQIGGVRGGSIPPSSDKSEPRAQEKPLASASSSAPSNRKRRRIPSASIKRVGPEKAIELLKKGYLFLDVRNGTEFAIGHIPDAMNIPFGKWIGSELIQNPRFLETVTKSIPQEQKLIVGCQTGKERSQLAAEALKGGGFRNVLQIVGGFAAWKGRGYPVTPSNRYSEGAKEETVKAGAASTAACAESEAPPHLA